MLTRAAMSLTLVAAAWQARLLVARPAEAQGEAEEQAVGAALLAVAARGGGAAAARGGGAEGVTALEAPARAPGREEQDLSAARGDALKLWCVLALLRLGEESVERLVSWVPGYSVAKLLLLAQIARAPETARVAFDACVAPTMERLALQVFRARAALLQLAVRLLAVLTGPDWHEELRAADKGELDHWRALLVGLISSADLVLRAVVAAEQEQGDESGTAPAGGGEAIEAACDPREPSARGAQRGQRTSERRAS
jgi:hypothetical protein